MNYVLGARGRLGHAIATSLPPGQIKVLDRSVYSEWWRDGAADLVSRFLDRPANGGVVYVAAGLIDPSCPSDEHHQVNYKLARNVVEGATKLGFRVVTFGTVMEKIVGGKSANPYYTSKTKLGFFIDEYSVKCNLALHVRIHTLFGGGLPDEFMFLGQMFRALISRSEFKMSPGTQFREYHHLDDEVAAIAKLLHFQVSGTTELSHGAPITLKDIATFVFDAFECPQMLKIAALPGPVDDNYRVSFSRTPALSDMVFRDTLPALVDYLRVCEGLSGK